MPTPYEMQRQQMASRMGAPSPGGPGVASGTPPPQGSPGQSPGGAPVSSRLEPLLQQVLQILVEGNPADLEAFGKFMGQLQQLMQDHGNGQGAGQVAPQGPPNAGGQPMGVPPAMAR
jgi:hypothetical protein